MKRILVIILLLVLLLVLVAAAWAVSAFVYFGPEFPRRDYLGDVIRDAAERMEMDPNDHRMSDSFEIIYKKYLEIERNELGLTEYKRTYIGGPLTLTNTLFEDSWYLTEHIPSVEDELRLFPTSLHRDGWKERRDLAERLLSSFDQAGMTQLVDEALGLPGLMPTADDLRNSNTLPRLGLLSAAQIEHLRAQRALAGGDYETVIKSIDRIVKIQECLYGYPAAHTHRLGCETNRYLFSIVKSLLLDGAPSEEVLGKLASALPDLPEDAMEHVLEYQRAFALDRLQNFIPTESLLKRHNFSYHAHRIHNWVDRYAGYSTKQRLERLELPDPGRHPDGSIDTRVERWNDLQTNMMFPSPRVNTRLSDESQTKVAGLKLWIAIERHGIRHGVYPDSLDDLDQDFLSSEIRDEYAPDGEFRYRLFDTPDEHGRAYVLYSVGVDGRDDGGDYHYLFMMDERQTHGDYIFNPQPFNDWEAFIEYTHENPG